MALSGSARRRMVRSGASRERTLRRASGWLVCTDSRGASVAALFLGGFRLGRLAQGVLAARGGQRDGQLGSGSTVTTPRLQVFPVALERCGMRLYTPAAYLLVTYTFLEHS